MQPLRGNEHSTSYFPDRRTKLRFEMNLPVLLHAIGEPWKIGVAANVSAKGAFVLTKDPLLLGARIEYVIKVPPELSKANQPLMIRFFGTALRCDSRRNGGFSFGIALESHEFRYLPVDEAAKFGALLDKMDDSR